MTEPILGVLNVILTKKESFTGAKNFPYTTDQIARRSMINLDPTAQAVIRSAGKNIEALLVKATEQLESMKLKEAS